jgi:hypothetical protein
VPTVLATDFDPLTRGHFDGYMVHAVAPVAHRSHVEGEPPMLTSASSPKYAGANGGSLATERDRTLRDHCVNDLRRRFPAEFQPIGRLRVHGLSTNDSKRADTRQYELDGPIANPLRRSHQLTPGGFAWCPS